MLGIETQEGFGLGNQLFFYVTTRCIALDKGYQFSVLDPEHFANNMHSDCGLYFMDLDMGLPSKKEDYQKVYYEKETRLFAGNSRHDLTHGVYVTDEDKQLLRSRMIRFCTAICRRRTILSLIRKRSRGGLR